MKPAWRQSRGLILLLALLGMAGTARLGFWQLDRAQQKLARQAQLDQRAALPALAAADLPLAGQALPAELPQRRIKLQGRWINERSIWLDNRVMAGRTGFYLLTPLALTQGGNVLVQRGWWPRDATDRSRLPALPGATSELVAVSGRILATASLAYQLGEDAPGSLIRQNVDLNALAEEFHLPLRPLVVLQEDGDDAAEPTASPRLLRQWPPPATDVSKHHGYAAQWFALSALILVLYVWFQLIRPRRHAR